MLMSCIMTKIKHATSLLNKTLKYNNKNCSLIEYLSSLEQIPRLQNHKYAYDQTFLFEGKE